MDIEGQGAPGAGPTTGTMAGGSSAAGAGARPYLIFFLGQESFAIPIRQIREILDYTEPTPVPTMPEAILGVINLRGAVVPVIDLSARFGRGPTQVGRRACIVILELEAGPGEGEDRPQVLGILVDGVKEVLAIPATDIEAAPSFGTRLPTDFIAGMARVGGRFIVILELLRVLDGDELAGSPGGAADPAAPTARPQGLPA